MSTSQVLRNVLALAVILAAVGTYAFYRAPVLPADFDAMEPVYPAGSRFLVNIRARTPVAGQDVYYRYEYEGSSAKQIGRVAAAPGDTVRLDASNRAVWGQFEADVDGTGVPVGRVPEGRYYLHRVNESTDWVDSRNFGLVPAEDIIGTVVATLPF